MTNHEWLSLAVIGVHWFRPADGQGWHVLVAAAVVALMALLRFIWLYRGHSNRRWKAALDAYAEREIARDRRRNAPPAVA
jgi:cytochrome b